MFPIFPFKHCMKFPFQLWDSLKLTKIKQVHLERKNYCLLTCAEKTSGRSPRFFHQRYIKDLWSLQCNDFVLSSSSKVDPPKADMFTTFGLGWAETASSHHMRCVPCISRTFFGLSKGFRGVIQHISKRDDSAMDHSLLVMWYLLHSDPVMGRRKWVLFGIEAK